MQTKPQAKYLKNYQTPSHTVSNFELEVELHPTETKVKAKATYKCNRAEATLRLDGVDLQLNTVRVNGEDFKDYVQEPTSLTLSNLPEKFTLEIENTISELECSL